MLSVREFRRLDANAVEQGTSIATLMGNAGKALAMAVLAHKPRTVVLLCGKGNNGGDGFAAAGILMRKGVDVRVVLLEPATRIRGAARAYLNLLPAEIVSSWKPRLAGADVVVDCMLGSGLTGKPRRPYAAAIPWFNRQKAKRIACDIATGLGTRLACKPHETVTFHATKAGMTKANSGTIRVADIGIRHTDRVGVGDLELAFPPANKNAHKGGHGRVLIVGGGPYVGAPHYAGMAAARTGADLVQVAAPEPASRIMQTWGPDLLHLALPGEVVDDLDAALAMLAHVDAVVIGPGLGRAPATVAAVQQFIRRSQMPLVVDADALHMLNAPTLKALRGRAVLTPHGAEFKAMAGKVGSAKNVAAFAKAHKVVVLRKGAVDVVSDGTTTRRCERGHPTMTVGGTGDVLAGAVGALLARGASPLEAACAGAYLVGCAGEVAGAIRSHGASASDVLEAIPSVLLRL